MVQVGEFKQEIMKVNNRVNMEVFNQGLKHQKVEIIQDKVLIIAHNNRVKVLSVVDKNDTMATRMLDLALLMEFKSRFIMAMQDHFGITVLTHMKDYDPQLELSFSLTIFDRPVEDFLPGLQVIDK